MEDNPMVSVIVPAHNSSEWIKNCLLSICNQTYTNIEMIVVDDGSTDNTVEIIKGLDIDLILIAQDNLGRSGARNSGIEKASGKYVSFLDSDDLLGETSVEERVRFLENSSEYGWVFTDAVEFDENGDLGLFLGQFPWLDIEKDQFIQLLHNCYPLTSTVMVASDILRTIGLFDPSLNYAEDLELFMRLILVSKVGMIRVPLSRRRIHAGQAISSTFDRWESRVRIFSSFKPEQRELTDVRMSALDNALKHAYFKLGECFWKEYDKERATGCFECSLGENEWSRKARMYLKLLRLPTPLLRFLRKIRGH